MDQICKIDRDFSYLYNTIDEKLMKFSKWSSGHSGHSQVPEENVNEIPMFM